MLISVQNFCISLQCVYMISAIWQNPTECVRGDMSQNDIQVTCWNNSTCIPAHVLCKHLPQMEKPLAQMLLILILFLIRVVFRSFGFKMPQEVSLKNNTCWCILTDKGFFNYYYFFNCYRRQTTSFLCVTGLSLCESVMQGSMHTCRF